MTRIFLFSLLILPIFGIAQRTDNSLLVSQTGDKYLKGVINFKVKPEYRSACSESAVAIPELLKEFDAFGLESLEKKFPRTQPPATEFNDRGQKLADISLIYEAKINDNSDVFSAVRKLENSPWIEYAEPQFVSFDMYTPNDANLNSVMPYHYANIMAYEAWDITLGDTNVVIGITETAINVNHEDLSGNIKYNYDDPIGNGDDDNDTYVDNFAGWDMVDNDNSLFINNEIHGDAVSAIASATADNGIGYAGIGFKCKFLPVKVGNNSQTITKGYEGIQYCVEHGCSVVNCSWGNTTFSQVAQDVVTWAAVNNNVVLVASAGNANATAMYYPASYNYVLSVTGVDANDLFNNGTNTPFTRNDSVDVSAPGINIYTTATFNGTFLYSPPQGGTSMAAPIVSGVAGLVRTKFPCLTALEVIERIKSTSDDIDNLTQNLPYAGLIGAGRVNAAAAVTGDDCATVGIAEEDNSVSLDIYPNPSSEDVTLKMGIASTWMIEILDMRGRLVLTQNLVGSRITVSGLNTGIYMARVSDGRSRLTERFSIIKQ
ncbi:MAG: S8 family peptidase [Flavobacteriales bacterium]|nr:S8 family peptidase [Flavobacteriales bacterium]